LQELFENPLHDLDLIGRAVPEPDVVGEKILPLSVLQNALRVCPDTSGRIAEFSEHEAD
jgi:hypothetical protein